MSDTAKGVVKWFNDAKGFGFIEHTSGKDVFVHYSVIQADGFKTLKDGEEVEYEMVEGPKGFYAAKVTRSAAAIAESEASAQAAATSSDDDSEESDSDDDSDSVDADESNSDMHN